MSRLAWTLKNAAKTTAKGAAITLTSTVFSCALACYIEIGGHRLVYRYFPHKYANVMHANGLTQEQLEAVRVHKIPDQKIPTQSQEQEHETFREQQPLKVFSEREKSTGNMFSKEEKVASTRIWPEKQDFGLASQEEVVACSMTG
jgi:hypothetical protein